MFWKQLGAWLSAESCSGNVAQLIVVAYDPLATPMNAGTVSQRGVDLRDLYTPIRLQIVFTQVSILSFNITLLIPKGIVKRKCCMWFTEDSKVSFK